MSTITCKTDTNIINKDKSNSSPFNKINSMDCIYYRSDIIDTEKSIPNIFITPEFNCSVGIVSSLSAIERERDVSNIFNINRFQAGSTQTSNYVDKYFEYPDLFTLHESYLEPCSVKSDVWEKYSIYTNVFSLSDILHNDFTQRLEINNSKNTKQERTKLISNDKLFHASSSEEMFNDNNKSEVNDLNTAILEDNSEKEMSSALCFWCITTGINVRDHNIKTCFPQREINSTCIMVDVKLMLINMGTTYFFVDEETQMYKRNGNISMSGLTPEMFEFATDPILECSNLYRMLCITIVKWKKICDDNIVKALIFAVSNILDDYERTIYAVSDESLLSLVDRLYHITPRLQLLANICCLKKTNDCFIVPDHISCGIKLLNKIHNYLFDYRFPHDLFLKMLLYMFESCCLAYFKILSKWALEGILINNESAMFIQLKPDIEDEDVISRRHWDRYIISERVEVPVFLNKYKNDILNCGKTINFFNKFNNLNVFLPDFTCCFDDVDTQWAYEKFTKYYKFESGLKTTNFVKRMPNCYLFESIFSHVHPKENTDCDKINNATETVKMYSNNENCDFFQIHNWTYVENKYNFNEPYGFFMIYNDLLTYNGKPVDVISMIDYIPHSILIPARIQKTVCDRQILDMFFVQKNLMDHLYYLSQCFFLMNWQFSSKLCDTLFDGIITNRQNPVNIFNTIKLKSIVDEAVEDSFSGNKQHNLRLVMTFIPHLNGIIDISDIECIELNYLPEWPMNMILSNKILLKYRRIFKFANKLEYVSWSLSKARELLSVHKNDIGLQFRKINIFKHWMNQFISSIQQYYKQVVISTCWAELNKSLENVQNYDELFSYHKQYMHTMLRRCLMVVGHKDKLILLNKIYMEILAYYQALASGQFYMENLVLLHSEFYSMERSFYQFEKLREMFYISVLNTVQANGKHNVELLESLIIILGPPCSFK